MTVPTGSSRGRGVTTGDGLILPSRSPQLCATLRGINSLATASPAGAGFAAAGWTAPRRQAGEQQLSDPVRLFQMRIAGKDKAIDTQRGVFIDPFGNGGGIAHQRGPGAAARKPTPAHRLGLISSLSRRPLCRAAILCWPTESVLAKAARRGRSSRRQDGR